MICQPQLAQWSCSGWMAELSSHYILKQLVNFWGAGSYIGLAGYPVWPNIRPDSGN